MRKILQGWCLHQSSRSFVAAFYLLVALFAMLIAIPKECFAVCWSSLRLFIPLIVPTLAFFQVKRFNGLIIKCGIIFGWFGHAAVRDFVSTSFGHRGSQKA